MDNVEEDPQPTTELPTYEESVAHDPPNTRFGRWQGWIDKRATERFNAITDEDRARQRQRGWGNDILPSLHTLGQASSGQNAPTYAPPPMSIEPPILVEKTLAPTHLKMSLFGSRFLPHTTSQIRCLLPLPGHQSLLIGHDHGLSVLDMFPQGFDDAGEPIQQGPDEAKAFSIWQGESVYQLTLLESEGSPQGMLAGVVLALVSPQPDNTHHEPFRTLRMYNLSSLISLAQWSISHKGTQPLLLQGESERLLSPRRHRPQTSKSSIKGFLSIAEPSSPSLPESFCPPLPKPDLVAAGLFPRPRKTSVESTKDTVNDPVALQWATDYVPFTPPRLVYNSAISYTLWRQENGLTRGATLLAVGTKNNIILYEAPKGKREFQFVKEFYVPSPPLSITFLTQCVDSIQRSPIDTSSPRWSHRRSDSHANVLHKRTNSGLRFDPTFLYDPQLSLFVTFDKKASWIRLVDAVVGEVSLYDETFNSLRPPDSPTRRPRSSTVERDTKAQWIPPVYIELVSSASTVRHPRQHKHVHILTRGKQSHFIPCPLPALVHATPPICVVTWESAPSSVIPRVCGTEDQPFLQLTAFSEDGLEVQELSLSSLSKGKSKGTPQDFRWVQADVGGTSGFLCRGGHWQRVTPRHMSRSVSESSFDSLSSEALAAQLLAEQGIYGWCRKGLEDWRVFWVGGNGSEGNDESNA